MVDGIAPTLREGVTHATVEESGNSRVGAPWTPTLRRLPRIERGELTPTSDGPRGAQ
jgi:hypothetical protein